MDLQGETKMFYSILKVDEVEIGFVWSSIVKKTLIERIYLPNSRENLLGKIFRDFPAITSKQRVVNGGISQAITDLYKGRERYFDFTLLNFSPLTEFARCVLLKTCKIPHGRVATYSDLAAAAGHPRACRAVGTIMANNPFPIVIPCHRVIRSDGNPGQFGGGCAMKRRLLEKEGVFFAPSGMVLSKYLIF
jgi:methylated-DNA-[protein]-cysteine S-methyltransferase